MSSVTAGEIKRRGIGILDPILKEHGEAIVTVHGKGAYVVMTQECYNRVREAELSQAVREAQIDYRTGRVADRTVKAHLKRLDHEL